jgi:hypothetical protein
MGELTRDPRRGEDILSQFVSLKRDLRRERIVSVVGGMLNQTDGGKSITIPPARGGGGSAKNTPERPGGDDEAVPVAHCYSFEAWSNVARTGIIMEPGDILLGPLSFIDWADIDGYDTTPAVTSTNTHVWLEVRVDSLIEPTGSLGAGYAWLKVGTKAGMRAALDSTEILAKTVVPLVETTWASDGETPPVYTITKVKGLQCGDATLYRSG